MFRKVTLILVLVLLSTTAFAFDSADFTKSLGEFAEGISQSAYAASERDESNERAASEAAAERADKAEKRIREMVSSISNEDDLRSAQKALEAFAKGGKLNSHTVAVVEKMLKQRVAFVNNSTADASNLSLNAVGHAARQPEMLLSSRQKRMVMLEIPVVEAAISLEDTKQNRRIENLQEIFKRHNIRVVSQSTQDGDKLTHGFLFSGKKYIVDALLGHFGGDLVQADLKAVVKVTSGGFWGGKKSVDFTISPNRSNSVMGELSWYKSVIEKDPTRYLAENNYSQLATLGKTTSVAGETKLQLKNTVVEIWVMSKNGSTKNAVYSSKIDLGDVFVDAR